MSVIITSVAGEVFTFQDGDVQTVSSDVRSNSEVEGIYGDDYTGAFVSDYEGVVKRITIKGALHDAATTRVTGDTVTTIAQQLAWLEALQTGAQTISSTLNEIKTTFYTDNVLVESFSTDEIAGESEHLPFTMVLVAGTPI